MVAEKRALSADLPAFEQGLTSVDSFDNVKNGDFCRWARQGKAAADSLARADDARLLKLGEKLRNEFRRDFLQLGKIPRACRLLQLLRIDEIKQTVQSVFDTCAYMGHGTVQ